MRRRYVKRGLMCGIIAAALCLTAVLSIPGAYAQETGGGEETAALPEITPEAPASLTLKAANGEGFKEDLEFANAEVTVNVYKVADVNANGTFTPVAPYTDIEIAEVGSKASAWIDEAKKIVEKISEPGEGQTAPEPVGTVTFAIGGEGAQVEGIAGTGLYLVWPQAIETASHSYQFTPYLVSLPSWNEEDGHWGYTVTSFLKMEQDLRRGPLTIRKSVNTFNESLGPVTFIFRIDAELNGENVYSNVVSLVFTDGAPMEVTVDDVPLGTTVTVTEVYSSASYHIADDGNGTYTIELFNENNNTASFVNDYTNGRSHGTSVVNHFEPMGEGWEWSQQ